MTSNSIFISPGALAIALLFWASPAFGQDLRPAQASEILEHIANSDSEVVLVNLWATWCSPCVKEFPEIVSLAKRYDRASLDIVFVSLDFPEDREQTLAFLEDKSWTRLSYIRDGLDSDFVNGFITEWTGAVPATFVYDSSGDLVWSKESITSETELSSVIDALLP